jgi:hypothetical protein
MSLLGHSSLAAGFVRVNLRLSTPCRYSRGNSDHRMAPAWRDLFLLWPLTKTSPNNIYIVQSHLLSILSSNLVCCLSFSLSSSHWNEYIISLVGADTSELDFFTFSGRKGSERLT